MSKKIWSSFYRTIHKINRYDLTKNEFIQLQQITVQKQIGHLKIVRMNPVLADILLRNLGGEIK